MRFTLPRLSVALLLLGALTICAAEPAPARKPNIIFILSDDVGLGDVRCTGGSFPTPQIDALAQGGTRYELCFATPLCGPTRCQFLTGRYPFRTGLISNQSKQALESHREIMIPTVMKQAGYASVCVGKWGQMPYGPGQWGFDEWLSFPGSGKFWKEQQSSYDQNGATKDLPEGTYLPDLMHGFLVDFMARHQDKPFFAYYSMSHMHGPIVRTPDSGKDRKPDELYADNVAYMDQLVGRLVKELDRLKLRENTLIVFTGDNGTARFGVDLCTVDGRAISGMKATMLEGGSRVPMIVNWPGTTPAGKVSRDLVDLSDFFATFAELGGAPLPKDVAIDGHSYAAQFRGQPGTPRDWVYVELNGKSYARNARYKLTNRGELFDLSEAPFKEIAVPSDTADAGAVAARKQLQAVLDSHPTAPGQELKKKADRKTNTEKRKRQAR